MIRDPPQRHVFPIMRIDVIQDLLNPLTSLRSLSVSLPIQGIGEMLYQKKENIQHNRLRLETESGRLLHIQKRQSLKQLTDGKVWFQLFPFQFLAHAARTPSGLPFFHCKRRFGRKEFAVHADPDLHELLAAAKLIDMPAPDHDEFPVHQIHGASVQKDRRIPVQKKYDLKSFHIMGSMVLSVIRDKVHADLCLLRLVMPLASSGHSVFSRYLHNVDAMHQRLHIMSAFSSIIPDILSILYHLKMSIFTQYQSNSLLISPPQNNYNKYRNKEIK